MSDEILTDVLQLRLASPTIEYIVGVIQWQGKLLAGPIYLPNIFLVKLQDGETPVDVVGITMLPNPRTAAQDGHWRPIDLTVRPTKNGIATTEDTPVMYLGVLPEGGGQGVALSSRYGDSGRVQWSGNPDIIDQVMQSLVKAGILISADRPGITT